MLVWASLTLGLYAFNMFHEKLEFISINVIQNLLLGFIDFVQENAPSLCW